MSRLSEVIREQSNLKFTEKGARAYSELENPVLTLFGQVGSLRSRNESDIISLFNEAYQYDKELTVKMLFYTGDIRGGLGERRTFNIGLKWLAINYPENVILNLHLISGYNRWDSLYSLINTPVEEDMWNLVRKQFTEDLVNFANQKPVSLLAKWMKSINASNEYTIYCGKKTAKALNLTNKEYRKILATLREYIRVTERNMSDNKWTSIDYSQVPSKAMKNYRNAFARHDNIGWQNYINSLQRGETKINSSVLYPYDIVEQYMDYYHEVNEDYDVILEQQWKALPDYLNGSNANIICMVDISGSMYGRPICSSAGLGIYFAQRNHGFFHNQFMTFSRNPKFISLNDGESLQKSLKRVFDSEVGYHTDLEAAFDKLLDVAIENHVSQTDMPKAIIIISDNEIDSFRNQKSVDFLSSMRSIYAAYGYELPKLVFFQVEARQSTFLTLNTNALFISGNSAVSFKHVCDNLDKTGWELCTSVLNSDRYKPIKIALEY